MLNFFSVHITLAFFVYTGVNANLLGCRCRPSEPCWPTPSTWATLNSSIGGNLIALKPLAAPCHDPTYDAAACAAVQANTQSSPYRSDQPGAFQWQNWEAWPDQNQQCYVGSPQSIPCGQGRVSLYSAMVESAADIQAAVKFATKHNIKIAIKNTGHDFLGRSSAPHSLQISTHRLKTITVLDSFVPSVPKDTKAPTGVKAVTIGAGMQLREMYAYLGTQGVMVVGGTSNTVGVAGGFIQGGGHSLMGWIAGMASDNALEFTVVIANGSLMTANAHQNSDLFFALRGGGGGTWGVVVSVTVKAYPDYPVTFTLTDFTLPNPNKDFWAGVETFHEYLVPFNDKGGTGYYYITPINPVPGPGNAATFALQMWFVNQTDLSITTALFQPFLADLQNSTGVAAVFQVFQFPTMSSMYATILAGTDPSGLLVQLGSRLVSRKFANSPGASAKIASALSTIKVGPADYIEGNVVAGGRVTANANINSAVNPAWRETVVHLLFTRQWATTTTVAQQAVIKANITDGGVPILKGFEPGQMGAYLNEADANEPSFQQSFWGSNYAKLFAIKLARDPTGVFISRKGVGSEIWDDAGICRSI